MPIITFLHSIDQVTVTARLILDNENYKKINSKNSRKFILQILKDELVQAIPIDPKRLELHEKVENENTNNQVLISATIMPPSTYNGNERNTDSVLKDLDELIKQKNYNLISNGNIAKFLDEYYGAQTIRKSYLLLKICASYVPNLLLKIFNLSTII
jgi:hypothetical protein